jgi:hypothetical protein
MTTITVKRGTPVPDEYGDPQMPPVSQWPVWRTFDGLVGWGNPDEPLEAGKNTIITNRTVYIESDTTTGILASDIVVIDGVEYAVDGTVAEWADEDGPVGAQFAIKAA